jgi:hypothetical protein
MPASIDASAPACWTERRSVATPLGLLPRPFEGNTMATAEVERLTRELCRRVLATPVRTTERA